MRRYVWVGAEVRGCLQVYVWDEFSEYLLDTRVLTSAALICILYEFFLNRYLIKTKSYNIIEAQHSRHVKDCIKEWVPKTAEGPISNLPKWSVYLVCSSYSTTYG